MENEQDKTTEETENGAVHASFEDLGLSETTLKAIKEKGFTEPTDIQAACIPLLLKEKVDVIGQAQTGTGKTAAFGLPILEELDEDDKSTQALILAPTRELAMQVAKEIESLKGDRNISIGAIYGGASYEGQFKALKKGLQIVVGTPGRIQDHLDRKTLDISKIKFAVLDEADEMLDMGFIEDIEKVLSSAPEGKRMLMFSATMPAPILRLAENFMGEYKIVRIKKATETPILTEQYYLPLRESDKIEALSRIIDFSDDFYAIVFCRTKVQCEEIGRKLQERGYNAEALHGDLSQKQRESILEKLKNHRLSILAATDVAARGIDVQDLTHVINFSLPQDPEVYIHRIGRTGRAGKTGTAITFVTPSEKRKFALIQKKSKSDIKLGTLPSAEEILGAKKRRITERCKAALNDDSAEYLDIATELLAENDGVQVASSLLKLLYGSVLDKSNYHHIKSLEKMNDGKAKSSEGKGEGNSDDRKRGKRERGNGHGGIARLFIALGRKDGFTKRAIANLLIEECGMKDQDVNDIEVMEQFSFVNVPDSDASYIIDRFESAGEDGKPLVTRAFMDKNGNEGKSRTKSRPVKRSNDFNSRSHFRGKRSNDYDDDFQRKDDAWYNDRKFSGSKAKKHGKYNKKRR